jgi:hypothetical protein
VIYSKAIQAIEDSTNLTDSSMLKKLK